MFLTNVVFQTMINEKYEQQDPVTVATTVVFVVRLIWQRGVQNRPEQNFAYYKNLARNLKARTLQNTDSIQVV